MFGPGHELTRQPSLWVGRLSGLSGHLSHSHLHHLGPCHFSLPRSFLQCPLLPLPRSHSNVARRCYSKTNAYSAVRKPKLNPQKRHPNVHRRLWRLSFRSHAKGSEGKRYTSRLTELKPKTLETITSQVLHCSHESFQSKMRTYAPCCRFLQVGSSHLIIGRCDPLLPGRSDHPAVPPAPPFEPPVRETLERHLGFLDGL